MFLIIIVVAVVAYVCYRKRTSGRAFPDYVPKFPDFPKLPDFPAGLVEWEREECEG